MRKLIIECEASDDLVLMGDHANQVSVAVTFIRGRVKVRDIQVRIEENESSQVRPHS